MTVWIVLWSIWLFGFAVGGLTFAVAMVRMVARGRVESIDAFVRAVRREEAA